MLVEFQKYITDETNCPAYTTFFKRRPHKMVKHTQTIRRLLKTNCLGVFDYFVGLALKGLKILLKKDTIPERIFPWINETYLKS